MSIIVLPLKSHSMINHYDRYPTGSSNIKHLARYEGSAFLFPINSVPIFPSTKQVVQHTNLQPIVGIGGAPQ